MYVCKSISISISTVLLFADGFHKPHLSKRGSEKDQALLKLS